MYFEVKVKYKKNDEKTGKEKKVNLPYLVDAISFTEAESRIYKEMEQIVRGELTITNIRPTNYTDLFIVNGDKLYKVKIQFMSIDEDSGKEKKVNNYILIGADNVEEADKETKYQLSHMTVDYDIKSIMETNIQDVFKY